MANYNAIKATTNAYIKTNGQREITGAILNAVMIAAINSLGRFYQFVGVADPLTDPGVPDQNVAYFAANEGIYINFGNLSLYPGEVAILKYDGNWVKESLITIPKKVSDLENDLGFVSRLTSDLANYYTKTDTYTRGEVGEILLHYYDKEEVDSIVGSLSRLSFIVSWDGNSMPVVGNIPAGVSVTWDGNTYVGTLAPSSETSGRVYLVSNGNGNNMYITTGESSYSWIFYGNTDLDLTGYATKADLDVVRKPVLAISDNFTFTESINLFDKEAVTSGKAVNKETGALFNSPSFSASAYIDVSGFPAGTEIRIRKNTAYSGSAGFAVFNSSKVFTHGGSVVATLQEGDAFIRYSIPDGEEDIVMIYAGDEAYTGEYQPFGMVYSQLKDGVVTTPKIQDNSVTEEKISDGAVTTPKILDGNVTIDKVAFKVIYTPKNLLNPALLIAGKWVNVNGGLSNVTPSSYGYYDYIGVLPETAYHISRINNGSVNANGGYIGFYDSNKAFISSVSANGTKDFTTPAGCAFVRLSVTLNRLNEAQLEVGNARTTYEAYYAPYYKIDPNSVVFPDNGVTTPKIADGAVTQEKIAPGVHMPALPPKFSGFKEKGTLSAGNSISTSQMYIPKNYRIVATILGVFDSVEVGFGRNGQYGKWIEITPTNILVKSGTSGTTDATWSHGLTLGERTQVVISKNVSSTATIRLVNDYGEIYSNTISFAGKMGVPFIYNGNTSNPVDVELSFLPGDIDKEIWVFGDSYLGMTDNARWMYYMIQWGFTKFLLDARGGENASQGLTDLQNLLSTGAVPSIILWTHGMNGGTDENGNVNSTWLSVMESVMAICTSYGITLVMATIPTIPNASHAALNAWVRESGYRYIDFAEAVEEAGTTSWRGWGTPDALLSNDQVHPSVRGAVELAMRALQDFPEIMVSE